MMRFSDQKRSYDSKELNDSLYELYKPVETPTMYVIFLHDLQSEDNVDPHLSTWKSGDGSSLWPQTWLIEKFPGAHVLCVSYSAHVKKNEQGKFDIYNIGENLLSDILQVNIGQVPYCPVILVGHCFGGFVIKELCYRAHDSFSRTPDLQKKVKLGMLLGNIRGIFYYGTPHHGSPVMDRKDNLGSNLLDYFKLLSKNGARLNANFEQLRHIYPKWRIHGLGENRSTKSGVFQGIVGAPEASSRAGDSFHVVDADHIQICRPEKKISRSFSDLVGLLESIATDVKEEQARAQEEEAQAAERSRHKNLQRLPKQIIGIEAPLKDVKTKLVLSRTVGLVGMGGCGKTTLAKEIFNNLVGGFEYSAFVLEVKLISGRKDYLKRKVWSQMHHFGEEMDANPKWSLLNQKSLLLVFDDVSTDRDLEVLFDIAEYLSPESRFLVTSRDRDLLMTLDEVYEVPFLKEGIAKELFMRHAFPEKNAAPSQLESLVGEIVEECDGLPLTLEIIGKYLYKRDDKQDWEQTLIALGRAYSVTGLDEKLWEKLKLSFDGLKEKEQQIFLDVATFFCDNDYCTLGEAKVSWKAAYGLDNERLLWRTLVDRSLVYDVKDTDTISMHEQLRDLGRKIGANHNQRRRIWDQKEARDLLQTTTQRHDKEIFALRLLDSTSEELIVARRNLLSLTEVRYLEVDANATISGGREDEAKLFLANLVFVRLHRVQQHFTSVFLDCTLLTRLVILHLDGYKEDYLPKSFSSMSALIHLDFYGCDKLQSLPDSFGNLSALSTLRFTDCSKLQSLPDSFGNLSALSTLQFSWCPKLQSLPDSFGNLSALSTLQFSWCFKLQSLPDSFGNLSALSTLQFSWCPELQSLPDSFGNLSALSTLQFSWCPELQSLPDSFGNLSALSTLQFSWCPELQSLPDSFGNLSALSTLQFTDCSKLQSLPDSFGNLSALSTIQFTDCSKLQSLPDSFGSLSALSTREDIEKQTHQDQEGAQEESKEATMMDVDHDSTANKAVFVAEEDAKKLNVMDEDNESNSGAGTPRNHLGHGKQLEVVKDFIRNINRGKSSYFISKAWLFRLEEHYKETVISVLRRAGFVEFYQTRTTINYRRIENSASHVEARDFLDSEMSTFENKFQLDIVRSDDNSRLGSPRSLPDKGKTALTSSNEKVESFKTALKDTGPHGYFVSTQWLSTLSDHEVGDLNVAFNKAGYSQLGKTSTATYFERHDRVDNNPGSRSETPSTSEKTIPCDRGRPSTSQDDTKVTNKIQEREEPPVNCECVPQILTLSCTPSFLSPVEASLQGRSRMSTRHRVGDCHVTVPTNLEQRTMSTRADKSIEMKTIDFDKMGKSYLKSYLLDVRAETSLTCCVTSDENDKRVRFEFWKIQGAVKTEESMKLGTSLVALRINVAAYINGSGPMRLVPLFGETGRLQIKGKNPEGSDPGSITLALLCPEDCTDSHSNRELLLWGFHQRVVFEGALPRYHCQNSLLELQVRYQLEICHDDCCDALLQRANYVGVDRKNKDVDFDCILEFSCRVT